MRTKIKFNVSGLDQLADDLNNNEFKIIPGNRLPIVAGLLTNRNSGITDSCTIGISASHIFFSMNRIDTQDFPDLINTELYVCEYDTTTKTIAPSGVLVYRGGDLWHHQDSSSDLIIGKTFDECGIDSTVLTIRGEILSPAHKRMIDDGFRKISKITKSS